jgi:hypothetical protein
VELLQLRGLVLVVAHLPDTSDGEGRDGCVGVRQVSVRSDTNPTECGILRSYPLLPSYSSHSHSLHSLHSFH